MNIQWRAGIEVCPRNRNKKVIQICHVTDTTPASPSRKIELSKSRAGIISFPLSFPFSRPHFSSTENADFEMKVARLKRHFFSFFFFFFFAKVNPLETLFLPFSPFAHKYLNKITIRGKEVGLIFKKAHPCIKDYETTMVESGGNFPPDYSREIVYREILKKNKKKKKKKHLSFTTLGHWFVSFSPFVRRKFTKKTILRDFNSRLNARGCAFRSGKKLLAWNAMNQHRTGRSAHEKGFHPFPRPFRCAPPFLRSLETNTADSEIVRETKYTCPRKLILSNLPFSSSLQDFFPSISSSQLFVRLTRLLI